MFGDAVRSSHKRVVHSQGLRWVSRLLLGAVPVSGRVWARPFLTVLATSQKTDQAQGRRHTTSLDWMRQLMRVVRRWLPKREWVLVVDGGLAAVKWGAVRRRQPGHPPSSRVFAWMLSCTPRRGPQAQKGPRQPSLKARLTDIRTAWQTVELAW